MSTGTVFGHTAEPPADASALGFLRPQPVAGGVAPWRAPSQSGPLFRLQDEDDDADLDEDEGDDADLDEDELEDDEDDIEEDDFEDDDPDDEDGDA